ncbi:flagellar assembly protein FliH [Rhodoferax sp.]|uniref:flagellar assembly protein FliH n=1 Tax=Rhodoferax sp. TaxID=50421 RepID=UPI002774C11B|nr:flagellar assembly protein FliH [Rhodoferax sp.]
MRNSTRFIPGEEIGAVAQWDFAAVDTASILLAAQAQAREAAAERGRDDAVRQEGYAQGFAQAQAQAVLETQQRIAEFTRNQGEEAAHRLAALFASTSLQLQQSEQAIAQGVLELACEVARQVLRQELSVNPNVLQPAVREALGLLLADSKSAVVRMNPLDLEVLEEPLRAEFSNLSLTLLADARVDRGGCLVESAGTVVDATMERRWARAVATLGLSVPWQESDDGA